MKVFTALLAKISVKM